MLVWGLPDRLSNHRLIPLYAGLSKIVSHEGVNNFYCGMLAVLKFVLDKIASTVTIKINNAKIIKYGLT